MYRELNNVEKELLGVLMTAEFQGREEIIQQLEMATAEEIAEDNDNYGSVYLKAGTAKAANVRQRIPVEGLLADSDGADISVLLHVVDGFINELEIIRNDGEKIRANIAAKNMKVLVNK